MSERIVSDPSQHGWVEVDGKWVWDASGGGAGAGMVISDSEPADKVEGMQWLNPTTGLVLFWDDEKWLQMPGGKDGADGADGTDGADGLWSDEGSNTISYSGTVLMSQLGAGEDAVAVGREAGENTQGEGGVAIGWGAGYGIQGERAVAVGTSAGLTNQGDYAIAVGSGAGYENQGANGIIINSSGKAQNSGNPNHIYITSGDSKYLLYNGSDAWYFAGGTVNGLNGFRQNGAPVIDAKGLITTLSTLRQATMDDTQDIRDSLRSAIDELVEGFEQEIAAMPAGDES